jgi:hypothetical protein
MSKSVDQRISVCPKLDVFHSGNLEIRNNFSFANRTPGISSHNPGGLGSNDQTGDGLWQENQLIDSRTASTNSIRKRCLRGNRSIACRSGWIPSMRSAAKRRKRATRGKVGELVEQGGVPKPRRNGGLAQKRAVECDEGRVRSNAG